MQRSDTDLILASVTDPRAFWEVYDRWAEPLLGYFYRRVPDPEVAADLMAETMAAAFESRSRFRDHGKPGSVWLYGIAKHKLAHFLRHRHVELSALRRLGLEVPELDDVSAEAIARLAGDDGRSSEIARALERVPAGEREAVELRVIQELQYREIAGRLDCSEQAARQRVHRGLARLGRLLEVHE
jgi:RNA polymerase sigma-70 factor (ECF subfamily)